VQITLYCEDTPGLKLGPGTTEAQPVTKYAGDPAPPTVGEVIVFRNGFATFDDAQYPLWEAWVHSFGTPFIRVIDADAGETAPSDDAVVCPECGKAFESTRKLNGHLMSHRR
jgi:hypothetical protein